MAQLYPQDTFIASGKRAEGGLQRELDIIRILDGVLSDDYCIFHGVDWYDIHEGKDRQGEIDVVVMNAAGDLLLIEIKAGSVEESADGFYKVYGDQRKDISRQCRIQLAALRRRLYESGLQPSLKHVLCLPDYRLKGGNSVAFPRERILDADDFAELGSKLRQLLPQATALPVADATKLFLLNTFRIAKSLDVLQEQLRRATYQLSDGLATWVPRMQSESGVFRIQATAGSGKTQLALKLLEDATKDGINALYVCFNRSLSDLISELAPARSTVTTFHELAVDHYRRVKGEPDFSLAEALNLAAIFYTTDVAALVASYDLMIIDEGQDFAPEWVESLLALLHPQGRLYLLEDEDQRLYKREEFELPDAVVLTCPDNFRNPRSVVQTINALGLTKRHVRAASPYVSPPQ